MQPDVRSTLATKTTILVIGASRVNQGNDCIQLPDRSLSTILLHKTLDSSNHMYRKQNKNLSKHQRMRYVIGRIEDTVGKGEYTRYWDISFSHDLN